MKNLTTAQKQREILANNLNDLLNKKRKTQADVIRDTGLAEAHGEGLAQENLIAFYEKQGFKQVTTNGNSTYMSL